MNRVGVGRLPIPVKAQLIRDIAQLSMDVLPLPDSPVVEVLIPAETAELARSTGPTLGSEIVPEVQPAEEIGVVVDKPSVLLVGLLLPFERSLPRVLTWKTTRVSVVGRASRMSRGIRAMFRPSLVSLRRVSPSPARRAPTSSSKARPSRMLRESGGSRKGKDSISPKSRAAICKITEASPVRWISGSVNSGRELRSSSEYRRMQTPGPSLPHLPARWSADAREIGSIGRRCTLVRRP